LTLVSDEDHAVMVSQGELQDAAFLVSLLESGGISTRMVGGVRAGGVQTDPAIYVRASDAEDARACIQHFERNGKRKD
jgi:hypothetical protein